MTTDELVKQLKADVAIQIAVAMATGTEGPPTGLATWANNLADALVDDQVRRGWIPREAEPGTGALMRRQAG